MCMRACAHEDISTKYETDRSCVVLDCTCTPFNKTNVFRTSNHQQRPNKAAWFLYVQYMNLSWLHNSFFGLGLASWYYQIHSFMQGPLHNDFFPTHSSPQNCRVFVTGSSNATGTLLKLCRTSSQLRAILVWWFIFTPSLYLAVNSC